MSLHAQVVNLEDKTAPSSSGSGSGSGSGSLGISIRKIALSKSKIVRRAVIPLVILGLIGFVTFAFCYEIVWLQVRPQHRGAAIAIICIFVVLEVWTLVLWALIFVYGPGQIDQSYAAAGDDSDPFLCTQDGYSLYCSTCRHIKPSRAHHSSHTNTCVPVLDHYCLWVGAIIGQRNRKVFIQFSLFMLAALCLVFIVLLIYQHSPLPKMSAFAIPLYVLCGMWLMFVGPLVWQHIRYVMLNQTTIDMLNLRAKIPIYVNLSIEGDTRRIVMLSDRKQLIPGPFHLGLFRNAAAILGPFWSWGLPLPAPMGEPPFSEQAVAKMREQAKHEMELERQGLLSPPPVVAPRSRLPPLCPSFIKCAPKAASPAPAPAQSSNV